MKAFGRHDDSLTVVSVSVCAAIGAGAGAGAGSAVPPGEAAVPSARALVSAPAEFDAIVLKNGFDRTMQNMYVYIFTSIKYLCVIAGTKNRIQYNGSMSQ